MKTIYFFFIMVFLLGSFDLSAQEIVSFDYDASGNRISRTIILEEQKTAPEFLPDSTYTKQSEIKEVETAKYWAKDGEKVITIYPNPNGGMFKIGFEGWAKELNGNLQLHTLNGNLILDEPLLQNNIKIDITDQPDGTYLLTISIDGRKETWKVVKR